MACIIRRSEVPAFASPSIGRLFNQFFNEPFFSDCCSPAASAIEGTLPVDLSEDETSLIVRASLPGFSKDDVHVDVNDGVLTIHAEHAEEKEERGEKFYRQERSFGVLTRRVALPVAIVEDQTKAELKDGVLTLRMPKSPKVMPRKINIG